MGQTSVAFRNSASRVAFGNDVAGLHPAAQSSRPQNPTNHEPITNDNSTHDPIYDSFHNPTHNHNVNRCNHHKRTDNHLQRMIATDKVNWIVDD